MSKVRQCHVLSTKSFPRLKIINFYLQKVLTKKSAKTSVHQKKKKISTLVIRSRSLYYDNCNDTLHPRFPYNNWFPLQILQNVLQNKWKELLWKEKTLRNNYLNHKTRSQNFLLNYGILYKADPDPYSDIKKWKLNFFMPKFTILIKKSFWQTWS